jgi:rare lipoprotein A
MDKNASCGISKRMKHPITTIMVMLLISFGNLFAEQGIASCYTVKTNKGHRTASGDKLSDNAYTAAHRTHPFGTKIKVKNIKNGKEVVVTINDRGPFIKGRVIDVTKIVAKELGFYYSIAPVVLEVVDND